MAENSRGMLFRKRNVLGAALVAGIGLGIYLGKFDGFGWGGSGSSGFGSSGDETNVSLESGEPSKSRLETADNVTPAADEDPDPVADQKVVRVVIDEESFLLRSAKDGSGDVPISLPKLTRLIEKATGDADGLRVRIYEKLTARPAAEESLKKALTAAGIPDSAVFWVPTPVK